MGNISMVVLFLASFRLIKIKEGPIFVYFVHTANTIIIILRFVSDFFNLSFNSDLAQWIFGAQFIFLWYIRMKCCFLRRVSFYRLLFIIESYVIINFNFLSFFSLVELFVWASFSFFFHITVLKLSLIMHKLIYPENQNLTSNPIKTNILLRLLKVSNLLVNLI